MRYWKNEIKRCITALCVLAMALTVGQIQAAADTSETVVEESGTFDLELSSGEIRMEKQGQLYCPELEALPDNDELFAGYVQNAFYGDVQNSRTASYGESRLTGLNLYIYQELKAQIEAVADGTRTNTEFTVSRPANIPSKVTAEDLNIQSDLVVNNSLTSEAENALNAKYDYNLRLIMDCLLEDCPYELYWYDKTKGASDTYLANEYGTYTDSTGAARQYLIIPDSWTFSFSVAKDYASGSERYTTDSTKTKATTTSVANARAIVAENVGKSDYEKLTAYKEKLCEMVEYNYDAMMDSYTGGYGNPWQLIYVFDNDKSTNVVCEGYSKAFQYLCDLSTFTDTTCYTVSGYMDEGAHMWNIVSLDGNRYLVDITNSDGTAIGASSGGLFLAGAASGSVEEGYHIQVGSETIVYTYDTDQITLYEGTDVLQLSAEKYVYPTVVITSQPQNQSVTYNASTQPELSVSAGKTSIAGETDEITYQWYEVDADGTAIAISSAKTSAYTFPQGKNPGVYQYYCEVTCGSYTKNSNTISVTVECTTHQPSEILYTGTDDVKPTCTQKGRGHRACTVCKEILEDNIEVDSLGHKWEDDYTVDVEATETTEGSKSIHCAVCGEKKEDSITSIPKIEPEATPDTVTPTEPEATPTSSTPTTPAASAENNTPASVVPAVTSGTSEKVSSENNSVQGTQDAENAAESGAADVAAPSASATVEETKEELPEKGDVVTDTATKAEYTVTKTGSTTGTKTGTVAYTKLDDKKATTVSIPKTVEIDGVTYKVTSVEDGAFKNCRKLKTVTLGSNITSIGKKAFQGCTALKTITISSKKLASKSISSKAFSGIGKNVVIKVPKSMVKTYTKLFRKKGLSKSVKIVAK